MDPWLLKVAPATHSGVTADPSEIMGELPWDRTNYAEY
jgi:hypothetical protein